LGKYDDLVMGFVEAFMCSIGKSEEKRVSINLLVFSLTKSVI
jgi:hypothetical protein